MSKPSLLSKHIPIQTNSQVFTEVGNSSSFSKSLSREDCYEILRELYLARYFDIRLIKEKKRGRLRGTLYSSHNQEAIMVGTTYALKPTDWVSPVHRDMPVFFLKDLKSGWDNPNRLGFSIEEVCAQVWAREGSPGRARDNWSHIGSRQKRIIHSTSMLAGTIPVSAGVALADRINGGDAVVLAYGGEGGTARGDFHEGMNFAAVRKLPLILVVENNQWAYGTPFELGCPTPNVADRACGYGIPGIVADGQDVFDVYDKINTCIERARSGDGPSILECKTYRAYGHGDHDDDRANKYRDHLEVERGRSRDPIFICKEHMIKMGYMTKEEASKYPAEFKGAAEATDQDFPPEVVEFIKRGVDFALKSPEPKAEEGAMWVFTEEK